MSREPLTVLQDQGSGLSEESRGPEVFDGVLGSRRVFVDTFGCQMNQHDSERMVGLMASEGYLPTADKSTADVVILNSCSVREKAEHKVLSAAGEIGKLKKDRPHVVLAVGGCVAQQEGKKLLDRAKHIDIVFGPDHLTELPRMVRDVQKSHTRIHESEFLDRNAYVFPPVTKKAPARVSNFVSVMKGCDKFCSFCIVPFTRGREVSRPAREIVEEVRLFAEQGTKEVVLLGQTVNSYGRREREGHIPFHELIHRVAEVPGIQRIRFTSPHPSDFSESQITAFRDIEKLCPHMHLPVQSGSSRVLSSMRRGYTRDEYLAIVDRLREVAPGVSLTTDFIVGFPGETEQEFEETLSLMERVRFQGSFSFVYSERVGTRALKIDPSVPEADRFSRLYRLQALQNAHTNQALTASLGKKVEVLIEGPSKSDKTRSTGRSGQNVPVHIDGTLPPGALVQARVTTALKHSLVAEVVEPA